MRGTNAQCIAQLNCSTDAQRASRIICGTSLKTQPQLNSSFRWTRPESATLDRHVLMVGEFSVAGAPSPMAHFLILCCVSTYPRIRYHGTVYVGSTETTFVARRFIINASRDMQESVFCGILQQTLRIHRNRIVRGERAQYGEKFFINPYSRGYFQERFMRHCRVPRANASYTSGAYSQV